MREFSKGVFRLRDAPAPIRLAYGAFLVFTGVGFLSQLGFQIGRVGVSPRAIAVYYRGGDTADVMSFAKTFGQLLEITHAHAFVMGLVFLVLAHLFLSTGFSARFKVGALVLGFGGTMLGVLSPWLVRYVAGGFAWLTLIAWIAGTAGNWAMVCASAWECRGRSH
jgi:hypothetical protein